MAKSLSYDASKVAVGTPDTPKPVAKIGARVKITRGEIPSDDCSTTNESATGVEGRVDGAPYVAQEGPNKGEVIQPVRTDEGALLGVPASRVQRKEVGKARSHFSMPHVSQERWDSIFGKK